METYDQLDSVLKILGGFVLCEIKGTTHWLGHLHPLSARPLLLRKKREVVLRLPADDKTHKEPE